MRKNRVSIRLSRYWKYLVKGKFSESTKARIFGDNRIYRALYLKCQRVLVSNVNKEWKTRWLANQVLKDLCDFNQKGITGFRKKGVTGKEFIVIQELRIDFVMFRLAWGNSMKECQQMIKEGKVILHTGGSKSEIIHPHPHTQMTVGNCLELLVDLELENKITHTLLDNDIQNNWLKEVYNDKGKLACFMVRKPYITRINLPLSLDIPKLKNVNSSKGKTSKFDLEK